MRLIILCICLSLLIFATACSKDKEKDEITYNIMSDADFDEFANTRDWGMWLGINTVVSKDRAVTNLEVYVDATPNISAINEGDVYTLKLNEVTVPVVTIIDTLYEDYLEFNNYETIILPLASSINVKFTKNGQTLIDKAVTIPKAPTNLVTPTTLDLSQPIPLSWSLSKNSHVQTVSIETSIDAHDNEYYSAFATPSARSHNFPANCVSVSETNWWEFIVNQFNLAEYQDNYILAQIYTSKTSDGKSTTKQFPKMLHHNK
jgi:hypothetical protein